MSIRYIVAGPEYWESIPQTRQLTCGRVRFTSSRCDPPRGAGVYVSKAEALDDSLNNRLQLIREIQRSADSWEYQQIIGFLY